MSSNKAAKVRKNDKNKARKLYPHLEGCELEPCSCGALSMRQYYLEVRLPRSRSRCHQPKKDSTNAAD